MFPTLQYGYENPKIWRVPELLEVSWRTKGINMEEPFFQIDQSLIRMEPDGILQTCMFGTNGSNYH